METRTEREKYGFVLKEFADGRPWIILEPVGGTNLKAAGNGFFAFDLKPGVSQAEAKRLVEALNRQIEGLSHTFDLPARFQSKPF